MIEDKKTIGLTPENRSVMDRIMEIGFFRDQKDAAMFAMAYAIGQATRPGNSEGAGTIWNVGSLDPDGEIRILIGNLFPDTSTPYRLLEFFVNAGLTQLGERMDKEPGMEITDFLADSGTRGATKPST
jgi:hypothetical protein